MSLFVSQTVKIPMSDVTKTKTRLNCFVMKRDGLPKTIARNSNSANKWSVDKRCQERSIKLVQLPYVIAIRSKDFINNVLYVGEWIQKNALS